jgi:hypothetical protein
MLHACFTPITLCFVYTSWHFYAFPGTNLLTRCHSASSLFSAVFVFQRSYTGNILGIGQNEARSGAPAIIYFTASDLVLTSVVRQQYIILPKEGAPTVSFFLLANVLIHHHLATPLPIRSLSNLRILNLLLRR